MKSLYANVYHKHHPIAPGDLYVPYRNDDYDFSSLDVSSSFLLMGALRIAVYKCIVIYDTNVAALRALSLTQPLFGHGRNSHANPSSKQMHLIDIVANSSKTLKTSEQKHSMDFVPTMVNFKNQ
jgi:hypothetical protein